MSRRPSLFVGRELRLGGNRKDWIGAIGMEILNRPPDFGHYCVLSGEGFSDQLEMP